MFNVWITYWFILVRPPAATYFSLPVHLRKLTGLDSSFLSPCVASLWRRNRKTVKLTGETSERERHFYFHSFSALGVASRPSCAANQPVVLTHFPASSVTSECAGDSFISCESHLFLPGRCVIITDLPAPPAGS